MDSSPRLIHTNPEKGFPLTARRRGGFIVSRRTLTELVDGFREVATASLADALDRRGLRGFMTFEMKPRTIVKKIVGPAVTVREVPSSEEQPPTKALQAIDSAEPGSVIVIGTDADAREVALWGGLMTAGAVARQLEGAVLNGGVRDIEEIRRDYGFAVYSKSVVPSTTLGRWIAIEMNVPVNCGGVTVNPGDIIVGDADGVVVVPRPFADEVLDDARDIEEKERKMVLYIQKVKSITRAVSEYNRI